MTFMILLIFLRIIFISAWLGFPWFSLHWNVLGSSPRLETRTSKMYVTRGLNMIEWEWMGWDVLQ